MKILSITAQKPHSTGSGVYLTELVNQWSRQGHAQGVVAGVYREDTVHLPAQTAFYPVYFNSPGLPFPIVGMSDEMPYPNTRYRDLTPGMAEQFEAAFYAVVKRAVEELQPDLVVCHHLYFLASLVRGWFPNKKVVAVCHGTDLRQVQKIPLKREFIIAQIQKMDAVFALHEEQQKEIESLFALPGGKSHVVGAGYNQDIFYPGHSRGKGGSNPLQLVFVGKVTGKKGVFSLLRALELLPYPPKALSVKLAGGPGPAQEYEQVTALAQAGKYPVQLLGPLPQPQLAELFRQSDVFVLPSFFEGLPLVNLEAMACGCQVVCSNLPGLAAWYNSNLPGNNVRFVPLPPMKNTDEPQPEGLPAFEQRLAQTLEQALSSPAGPPEGITRLSWQGVSQRILAAAGVE